MLQCLIAALVVAQTQGRTCAAVLRYLNAGMLLVPQQRLLNLACARGCVGRRKHVVNDPPTALNHYCSGVSLITRSSKGGLRHGTSPTAATRDDADPHAPGKLKR